MPKVPVHTVDLEDGDGADSTLRPGTSGKYIIVSVNANANQGFFQSTDERTSAELAAAKAFGKNFPGKKVISANMNQALANRKGKARTGKKLDLVATKTADGISISIASKSAGDAVTAKGHNLHVALNAIAEAYRKSKLSRSFQKGKRALKSRARENEVRRLDAGHQPADVDAKLTPG